MSSESCVSCLKSKAPFVCQSCNQSVCKSCVRFVDETQFVYALEIEKPAAGSYCIHCFDNKIQPKIEQYESVIEKANNVSVFYRRLNGKETRSFSRLEPVINVENCADEKEILMRLAYQAAKKGFNAIIDVETFSQKIKDGSYTTVVWRGAGIPATSTLKE